MKKAVTLTGRLKLTVLLLSLAMILMWVFFYFTLRATVSGYTLQNAERAAEYGIAGLNTSFLQMERLTLAMEREESVTELLAAESNLGFHNAAAAAEERLQGALSGKELLSDIIIYRADGLFYRLRGTLSNTGVQRLVYLIGRQREDYICVKLDGESCIGYIARLRDSGGAVFLMKEAETSELLGKSARGDMRFVLAAGEEIVASGGELPDGWTLSDFRDSAEHLRSARVGYTPFQLWVSYSARDRGLDTLFLAAMLLMALLLLAIMLVFLRFWRLSFFSPIQNVIDEVESFEGGSGRQLPLTGLTHIDGLVRGINGMARRIELRDRAMIVSLKKQINAHFIFNTLNILMALSEKGENGKAAELCAGLSQLLRYANDGESFIGGMEEFHILKIYADIMALRYPDRFTAEIEMEDVLEEAELPRMLLQPLLENAIIHGVIGSGRRGAVRVFAEDTGDGVRYTVEDDGDGMEPEELMTLRRTLSDAPNTEPDVEGLSHVALINIQRRLHSYFGEGRGLEISSEKGRGTAVSLVLPKRKN